MTAPKRIQRQRSKGWRKPEGAVYVGRGSKWGNPFRFVKRPDGVLVLFDVDGVRRASISPMCEEPDLLARRIVVSNFKRYAQDWDVSELRGRDLMCWCPTSMPCHADILLEFANREAD